MLVLIFPLFIFCTNTYPRISVLIASDNMDSIKEEYSINYFQQHMNDIQVTCNSIQNEEKKKSCIAFKNSFIGIYISKELNINQQIASIPKETDILYIMIDKVSTTIDFNNLQSHMTVIISSYDFNDGNNLLRALKNTKRIIYDSQNYNYLRLMDYMFLTEEPENEIKILGNMNSKVSHLTICSFKIEFEGNVNCQNLFLRNSIFISQSSDLIEHLNVEYFIEDFNSFAYNIDISYYVKQYSIYYEYNDENGLQTILLENDLYGTNLNIGGTSLSFDYRNEIGIIFTASFIDIIIKGNEFDKSNIINLTLIDDLIPLNLPTFQEMKTVTISSSGNNEFIENEPVFHITYNKNQIELDKKNLLIKIFEHQIFSYEPKYNVEESNDITISFGDDDKSRYDSDISVTNSNGIIEDGNSDDIVFSDNNNDPDSWDSDSRSINGNGKNESSNTKNNSGMIIGIVFGCIGVIIILSIFICIVYRKRITYNWSSEMGENTL